MADNFLLLIVSFAVFVSVAIFAAVCLRCGKRGPLDSIRQTHSYESSEFRVVRQAQPTIVWNSSRFPCTLPSPCLSSADPGPQPRHPSFNPPETESNPSYENPPDGPDSTNDESDLDDTGYLIVLAVDPDPATSLSRASTPSSDVRQEYVNVPMKVETSLTITEGRALERVDAEAGEYENVDPNDKESSESDSSEEGTNYVNVLDGTCTDL